MAELKKWRKYRAEVWPKQGLVRIIEQTFYAKRPDYKRKNLFENVIEVCKLTVPIPKVLVEVKKENFDQTAIQSDDRFFTSTNTVLQYCPERMKEAIDICLSGYNRTAVEITE